MNNLQKYQAKGRLKAGELNKTEQRYAARLDVLKQAGEVLWWLAHPMNLKLGDKCFYRVDFLVLTKEMQLEVHETKGNYITDDSLVKIKVAAEKFPFKFLVCQYKKGSWEKKEF